MTYELPLTWNWSSGQTGETSLEYPTPTWQKEQIEAGRPLMPHVELWPQFKWDRIKDYSTPAFETSISPKRSQAGDSTCTTKTTKRLRW